MANKMRLYLKRLKAMSAWGWFHSALMAVIGGGAAALQEALQVGKADFQALKRAALVGAGIALFGFLRKSPLPEAQQKKEGDR